MLNIDTAETAAAASEAPAAGDRPEVGRSLRIASALATALFAAIMTASGIAFIVGPKPVADGIRHLGYPPYFTPLLGLAKLLGVAALVAPGARRLREWAYAGFTFLFAAAILSHVASGEGPARATPAAFSLGLLLASYFLRRRAAATGPFVRMLARPEGAVATFWRAAPWLSRAALVPPTVIFIAVAARYLADPVGAAAGLGVSLATPQAVTTIRIGFAAFPLAFAAFLAACLFSTRRLLAGLALAVTVAAVATAVRALGISIDGTAAESVRLLRAELGLVAVLVAGLAVEIGRRRRAGA